MTLVLPINPLEAASQDRAHHPYSPSSLESREVCPCFQNRKSANRAASRGTLQHTAVETDADISTMDDDESVHAAMCSDFADRQFDLLTEEAARDNRTDKVLDLREAYLAVDTLEFSENLRGADGKVEERKFTATTAGYVDRVLISADRKRAVMLDWKFGAWAVTDAEHNLQGISYLLGLFREYPTVDKVTVYFLQPKLDRITFHAFQRDQIPELYLRVQTVVARAMTARQKTDSENWDMAKPTIPTCNFCDLLGRCDKIAAFACHVGHKFHPVQIPEDLTPTGLKTDKDATVGMRLATVVKIWADSFRKSMNDRVIRGAQNIPPGFTVQTKKNREMVDTAKFRQVALRRLTEGELASVAEYPFGKVEDLVNDKAPRGCKKQELEIFRQELKEIGAVKEGEPFSFLRAVNESRAPKALPEMVPAPG